MESYHLKQILYIDSSLYICTREKDKEQSYDVLLDLPQDIDINLRKLSFK
jgi:hypothetical protein